MRYSCHLPLLDDLISVGLLRKYQSMIIFDEFRQKYFKKSPVIIVIAIDSKPTDRFLNKLVVVVLHQFCRAILNFV
jgi:hypothetical protein